MSIESRSQQYGRIAGHWQIREFLGSGSGGKSAVFRLVHTDSNSVESALKVVNLIEKRGSIESLSEARKAEYERAKQESKDFAEREVLLMNKLQGRTNVVAYSDHTFVDWADETGFGCDLLIRMELLTDLRSEIEAERRFDQAEILKIGRDICTALVLCHGKNILHRDIKPENIFHNEDGNYKLGDFGVSRILSAAPMSKASTSVCTPEYAAPEQLSGKYDTRVDIYSLGLVLYELSNGNLLPFATSSYITDVEVQKRMLGTPLPVPCNASESFADVILKACAFHPDDRYQTAEDFLAELNHLAGFGSRPVKKVPPVGEGTQKVFPVGEGTQKATPAVGGNATQYAVPDIPRKSSGSQTVYAEPRAVSDTSFHAIQKDKPKVPKAAIISIALVFILAIGAAAVFGIGAVADWKAISGILDEANTLADAENYLGAIAKVNEGLDEYPDSDKLNDKLNELIALQSQMGQMQPTEHTQPTEQAVPPTTEQETAPEPEQLPESIAYTQAEAMDGTGNDGAAAIAFAKLGSYNDSLQRAEQLWNQVAVRETISAGGMHSVCLNSSGSVMAVGDNSDGRCNVGSWENIIAISAGYDHTVGLKDDGTVAAVGNNEYGQCDVYDWTNIVAISAGDWYTVGLKSDGTVVATGKNDAGECNLSDWTDIVSISAGMDHTVGLRSDGTVIAAGSGSSGRCDVSGWNNIVSVSAGLNHTVALKADGTVVVTGSNDYGQCNVTGWTNIVAISARNCYTVGLRADGTVVAVGYNQFGQCDVSGWHNVKWISAGWYHTLALKADGTVAVVGSNNDGQKNVSGWSAVQMP